MESALETLSKSLKLSNDARSFLIGHLVEGYSKMLKALREYSAGQESSQPTQIEGNDDDDDGMVDQWEWFRTMVYGWIAKGTSPQVSQFAVANGLKSILQQGSQNHFNYRFSSVVPLNVAFKAVLEYVAAEVLELSVNICRAEKSDTITADMMRAAIRGDSELAAFLDN